jgi:hypothetical protein
MPASRRVPRPRAERASKREVDRKQFVDGGVVPSIPGLVIEATDQPLLPTFCHELMLAPEHGRAKRQSPRLRANTPNDAASVTGNQTPNLIGEQRPNAHTERQPSLANGP